MTKSWQKLKDIEEIIVSGKFHWTASDTRKRPLRKYPARRKDDISSGEDDLAIRFSRAAGD